MNILDRRHGKWTDRFSDYLSGDLSEADFRNVEEHLDGCGACRTTLAQLRDVIEVAGGLEDLQPPRDLWMGIAATIQAPAPTEARDHIDVIALPTAASSSPGGPATVPGLWLTAPQLIAASIALIAVSALATWAAGPGLGVSADASEPQASVGTVSMVSDVAAPPESMADELAALEAALAEASSELDPNTVRVLERNLDVIERAIQDSRRALAQDPGNDFLASHLDRVYQRKLTYLRDATYVAEWSS